MAYLAFLHDLHPYRHVVSLGYFCGTALELKRYGLRDASYPFDWVVCSLQSVLGQLESGMDGVLLTGNLARDPVHPYIVRDEATGTAYFHDFVAERSIDEQVEAVRDKYRRRLRRLEAAQAQRTLFVRYLAGVEEYEYLRNNMSAVLALLRRRNATNDLLLVGEPGIPEDCAGLRVYRVQVDEADTVARQFVRKNGQLRRALLGLRYPPGLRLRNYARYARESIPLSVKSRLHSMGGALLRAIHRDSRA